MTGDVEEECSLLQMSQLEDTVSSNASIPVTQPSSSAFISSNMAMEDTCIYTAAIPTDLVGSFPEGSVLQIMPDSSIVAVAVKNLPTSNENSVTFKDSTFPIENTQTSLTLPNLLTESTHNNEAQAVDVPVCSEENMDIDLSFLNEAEENSAISDPKCLNENAVKELQGMIADVSSHSLNLLQNNLSLTDSNGKSGQEQASLEMPKDSDAPPGDVVMIDVTKPIQLSQNSLIMVNGQKCILQHDPQTGQVIAYPVKEQGKPHRRRGRPRKTPVEQQTDKETEQTGKNTSRDFESLSEEEKEKGLLEVVNDDGALVRRSSRKRKKAKVLKDYETGNLKQELGSDVDDMEVLDKDMESYNSRKKARGPGRPRKYTKITENAPEVNTNNVLGVKRQRGRPKKIVPENEPTQAFLVQTADGQTLMMQVPLSSIPPGISLQEMAQEIANKLNLGLNQASGTPSSDVKDTGSKELSTDPAEVSVRDTPEVTESVPEPALQDHSVGSTTNFPSIQVELNSTDENSGTVDSSCQEMLNNMNQIMDDTVCESEEVILESENCDKDIIIPENISENQTNMNVLEVPQCSEDNFCINMPSTTAAIDSTSMYCNFEHLTDHDFCMTKSNVAEEDLNGNFEQVQTTAETSKIIPKEQLFVKNSDLKNKVDFQLALKHESDIDSESQTIPIQELIINKRLNSENSEGYLLNPNKITDLIIHQKIPDIDCSTEITKNVLESVSVEAKNKVEDNSGCLQSESAAENIECSIVINNEYLSAPEGTEPNSSDKTSQFIKSDVLNSENQTFEVDMSVEKVSSSVVNDKAVVTNSATSVIPVPEKALPVILPVQYITGSKNCKICQTPYFTDEEIIEHFKSQHPKCICTECNYMNEHPYVIKRHAFRHTNHGCVCKVCNKKYKDMYILKMHIKMVHLPPDVLYVCEICEKKFTRKAHLKRHLRIHAPVKQYQCPYCDYKGCEKSDITKHLLIHEEPKFKCEICGKAFRHVKNKELHLKRHSGQRDYKCATCGFFGYTYTDIRKHIERRHSASCSQCKQVFTDNELLKEHKRTGSCQPTLLEENGGIKIEESPTITVVSKEAPLLDEMPLDILETDQPQVMTISECSEETLSALQNGQLIMTSVEGILNAQNGHLIVEGLEDNNITPDNLSVISFEKDSNKMITVVTADGRNLSLPLKNCSSLPLECITAAAENTITESFMLSNKTECES